MSDRKPPCFLVADFETTTGDQKAKPKDRETEVWLAGFADVDDYADRDSYVVTGDIESFFDKLEQYCEMHSDEYNEFVCFFHNLKFDGSFICVYLLEMGIPFDAFVNDMGTWYNVIIKYDDYKIVFRDSLKILTFSLATMAELFDTPTEKGDTPLLEYKPQVIEPEWEDYIKTDLEILAYSINAMYNIEGFTRYTNASEALNEFKQVECKGSDHNYRRKYPLLSADTDAYIRDAYRGGWTYVNPVFQNRLIEQGLMVFDINSMYPATMLDYALPYDYPEYFECKHGEEPAAECFVAKVWFTGDLKENHLPTLQVKDKLTCLELGIKGTEYVTTTNGEAIEITVTNYDLDLLRKHYKSPFDGGLPDIRFISYYSFRTKKGMFDRYIKKYRDLKENAKSPAEKQKAKIMLNSLYGKFGAKIVVKSKNILLENRTLKFKAAEPEVKDPEYIPLAVFITSISRHKIITAAQEHYDIFAYADTDSLHMVDEGSEIMLECHPTEFGKWDFEGYFCRAKYLKSKLYVEELPYGPIVKSYWKANGKEHHWLQVKAASMPPALKKQVTMERFKIGERFEGKKKQKQAKGGMILYDDFHTIRESTGGRFG